jgi:hypothetical protein
MQLTVHSPTLLGLLLDPYSSLSHSIFYGRASADAYLGTVGEEVTSWDNMISHVIVLSWTERRSETQDGSADLVWSARKRVLLFTRQKVSTKSREWGKKLKFLDKLSLRVHSRTRSF